MNEPEKSGRERLAPEREHTATPKVPPSNVPPGAEKETGPSNKLTPEEQMALYEKELKETDWGHQPC